LGALVERIRHGYEEITPGGGVHWLFRCCELARNTKLACRDKTPVEFDEDDKKAIEAARANGKEHKPVKTLIETRERGGFVIVAPSAGKVHPTGGTYRLVFGGLRTIETVTPEERQALHELARAFDQMPRMPLPVTHLPVQTDARRDGGRPGEDFDERASWEEILEPWGWKRIFARGETTYWRRPGKEHGASATTGHNGAGLKVFTTSTFFSNEGT
jgi:putative DNA primase/helicase